MWYNHAILVSMHLSISCQIFKAIHKNLIFLVLKLRHIWYQQLSELRRGVFSCWGSEQGEDKEIYDTSQKLLTGSVALARDSSLRRHHWEACWSVHPEKNNFFQKKKISFYFEHVYFVVIPACDLIMQLNLRTIYQSFTKKYSKWKRTWNTAIQQSCIPSKQSEINKFDQVRTCVLGTLDICFILTQQKILKRERLF